jgi:hypothetical protein
VGGYASPVELREDAGEWIDSRAARQLSAAIRGDDLLAVRTHCAALRQEVVRDPSLLRLVARFFQRLLADPRERAASAGEVFRLLAFGLREGREGREPADGPMDGTLPRVGLETARAVFLALAPTSSRRCASLLVHLRNAVAPSASSPRASSSLVVVEAETGWRQELGDSLGALTELVNRIGPRCLRHAATRSTIFDRAFAGTRRLLSPVSPDHGGQAGTTEEKPGDLHVGFQADEVDPVCVEILAQRCRMFIPDYRVSAAIRRMALRRSGQAQCGARLFPVVLAIVRSWRAITAPGARCVLTSLELEAVLRLPNADERREWVDMLTTAGPPVQLHSELDLQRCHTTGFREGEDPTAWLHATVPVRRRRTGELRPPCWPCPDSDTALTLEWTLTIPSLFYLRRQDELRTAVRRRMRELVDDCAARRLPVPLLELVLAYVLSALDRLIVVESPDPHLARQLTASILRRTVGPLAAVSLPSAPRPRVLPLTASVPPARA